MSNILSLYLRKNRIISNGGIVCKIPRESICIRITSNESGSIILKYYVSKSGKLYRITKAKQYSIVIIKIDSIHE